MSVKAKQPESEAAQSIDQKQYITFMLRQELCAIPLDGVKEIIEYADITPIPSVPTFVRGVINLRGRVVPVIDLAARLGDSRVELTPRTSIVIVEVDDGNDRQDMGMVVDSVSAVVTIPKTDIEPAPTFGAKMRIDFIHGMWKRNDQFLIILEAGKVLSTDEITLLTSSTQER